MTIEATLESIDTTLKALLAAVQSGAQIQAAAAAAAPAVETKKTTRGKAKDQAPAVAQTTRFFKDESTGLGIRVEVGDVLPQGDKFKEVSEAEFTAAAAALGKDDAAQTGASTTQAGATSAPSATAQQDTASAATSEVTFDDVTKKLKELMGKPEHGPAAVKALITHFDPTAANVPALAKLNKNAEIIAYVDNLLSPAASDDAALWG